MGFLELRDVLSKEPSQDTWNDLCQVFEHWKEGDVHTALPYANEHLVDWDDDLRLVEDFKANRKPPIWWPLVRKLTYKSLKKALPKKFRDKQIFQDITSLDLEDCPELNDISNLTGFPNLKELNIPWSYHIKDIESLKTCPKLERLRLGSCASLDNLDPMKRLMHLEYIAIAQYPHLEDCSLFANATQLSSLKLGLIPFLDNIQDLKLHDRLKSLHISDAWGMTDVSVIAELKNLHDLKLENCEELDLQPTKEHMKSREEVLEYQERIRQYYAS